jgi:3-oxoacyl-(acyl-carrier-protein) synthase
MLPKGKVQTLSEDINALLKESYAFLEFSYPKFHKMDNLAKMAMVGVEYLLHDCHPKCEDDEMAMVFMNSNSSIDSDWNHQKLINQNKNVSPSVFVYTLPNILMGELAIKHQWYGENLFILAPQFSLEKWLDKAEQLFKLNKAEYCIGGWVEVFENEYEAKLILAQKGDAQNAIPLAQVMNDLKG